VASAQTAMNVTTRLIFCLNVITYCTAADFSRGSTVHLEFGRSPGRASVTFSLVQRYPSSTVLSLSPEGDSTAGAVFGRSARTEQDELESELIQQRWSAANARPFRLRFCLQESTVPRDRNPLTNGDL
jgi:hypothetical protein